MNNSRWIKSLALILVALVLLLPTPSLAEDMAPAPDATPSQPPETGMETGGSGVLRVYLQSLENPEALGLTLMGSYAMENDTGFRFANGTQITVAVDGESLLLSVGGLSIDMGPSMTLTRHATTGESGLYIHGSRRDNLYVGDLQLSVADGAISPVLLIDVEEYLYGVVPYEMSDSFPIEALKAQAVAARTYAMSRQFVSKAKAYDVVDTTNDQVFFGFDPDCENAIAAVDATKGIVGLYKGNYAACYYTASNGGQTAMPNHIWGYEGDYGYLDIRDDPYDLENSASPVKSMEISASGANLTGELKTLLKAGIAEELLSMGYSDDANDYDIVSILAIEPTAPRFDDGSRLYDKLRFTMKVAARHWDEVQVPVETPPPAEETPAPDGEAPVETGMPADPANGAEASDQPVEAPTAEPAEVEMKTELRLGEKLEIDAALTADLSVFDHFKRKFDMKISSADCELVSVIAHIPEPEPTEPPAEGTAPEEGAQEAPVPNAQPQELAPTSFTVQLRRFGHGVGMSQRGAQTMAGQYAFAWRDILGFYYPHMEIVDMQYTVPTLSNLSDLPTSLGYARPRPTPKPTPAPLPALTEGQRYARTALASKSSTLNVRESPVDGRVVDVLGQNQRMIVTGDVVDGWVHIRTAEVEGYVSAEYIQFEE